MTVVCDFDVHLRIVASNGTTVLGDLNDQAAGLALVRGIERPEGALEWERYTSPRAKGDFTQGAPRDAAGDLVVGVLVTGDTWGQMETRWATAAGWLNAEWHYFVELVEDGVTTRWHTDRPPFSRLSYDRANNRSVYQVRFHVQPNPVVTIA